MPGIAGIFAKTQAPESARALVQAMLASMQHEPTYVTGTCDDPQLGLYAGWVAHDGSFAAQQSGAANPQGIALAFAGECFEDAPATGAWLRDRYTKEGDAFVSSLNGLFSGLLIDTRQHRALLFNDRYGIERLYWHETPDALYFASEAKALLRVLPALRSFDEEGVAQFLAYGCSLDSRTLFRGVSLAGGGCLWSFSAGAPARQARYFQPADWENLPTISEEQFDEEFLQLFPRIFKKYTRTADNQGLGVSLTGGFDSRMVMACLPPEAKPACYTYAAQQGETLDVRIAQKVSRQLGLQHHTLRIQEDFLTDFSRWVDRSVYISDGCCGALGAHEIYYSQAVRKIAPVRLTGNFGSEVLRSISTFKPLKLSGALLSSATAAAVARIEQAGVGQLAPVTFAAFHEVPRPLFGTLAAGRSQVTFRTPYLDNELVALAYRAPDSARTSPLPALRFLGKIHPKLASIATDRGQIGTSRGPAWLARRIFAEVTFKLDYMHKEGLPKKLAPFDPLLNALGPLGLLGLHKFLPYRRWFRNELAPQLRGVFAGPGARALPFFEPKNLDALLGAHLQGGTNNVREIGTVLTLEAVDRLLLRDH